MKLRNAHMSDAADICRIVNHYAERGRMLHRSLESVYESLREFRVAVDGTGHNERIVGCVAVDIFWADLAEIKSLAVDSQCRGKGIGAKLVKAAVADARRLGVKKLFALTYEQAFFAKLGFEVVDRETLPEKVWRECIYCSKADACDEIAVMRFLDPPKKKIKKKKKAAPRRKNSKKARSRRQ